MSEALPGRIAGFAARLFVIQLFLGSAISTLLGGWPKLRGVVASHGYPLPDVWVGAAVALEIVASIALFFPSVARWAALALAGYAALATSLFHSNFAVPGELHLFAKDWAIAGALVLFFIAEGRRQAERGADAS